MRGRWIFRIGALLLAAAVVILFFAALQRLDTGQTEEGRQQLESALRRAAVACYAAEGYYPPNIDYLVRHYGIQIDERRYTVFYEVFAENLMPEITVLINES